MADPSDTAARHRRAGQVWGLQHPFERNHLQRSLVLVGLALVFAVAVVLLSERDVREVLGLSLVGAGLSVAMAAVSRARYVAETRLGFAILDSRDGRFILGSALCFVPVGLLVVGLIVG